MCDGCEKNSILFLLLLIGWYIEDVDGWIGIGIGYTTILKGKETVRATHELKLNKFFEEIALSNNL